VKKYDPAYMQELLREICSGDSNAFASMYGITYQDQYAHAYHHLHDIYLTQDALTETYIRAKNELTKMPSGIPFVIWLTWINDEVCDYILRYTVKAEPADSVPAGCFGGTKSADNVPASVSSGSKSADSVPDGDVAGSGVADSVPAESIKHAETVPSGKDDGEEAVPPLDDELAEQMLYNILDTLDMPQNTIPLEKLKIYTSYRTQKSRLQRTIALVAIAMLILIPYYFIRPNMTMEKTSNADEAGRPVYTVQVDSVLETYSVTAVIGGVQMPVYQESVETYSVRPTKTGKMTVVVTAENRRSVSETVKVDPDDTEPPRLNYRKVNDDGTVTFVFSDDSGISFKDIYEESSNGQISYPVSWDEDTNAVVFDYPSSRSVIYVPDVTGNRLKLVVNP
jgi:hypothetical protein